MIACSGCLLPGRRSTDVVATVKRWFTARHRAVLTSGCSTLPSERRNPQPQYPPSRVAPSRGCPGSRHRPHRRHAARRRGPGRRRAGGTQPLHGAGGARVRSPDPATRRVKPATFGLHPPASRRIARERVPRARGDRDARGPAAGLDAGDRHVARRAAVATGRAAFRHGRGTLWQASAGDTGTPTRRGPLGQGGRAWLRYGPLPRPCWAIEASAAGRRPRHRPACRP